MVSGYVLEVPSSISPPRVLLPQPAQSNSSLHSPFQRTWGHRGRLADAQAGRLLGLLVKVLAGECLELLRVVLLDGAALAVEALDVVEPCDAVGDPGVCGFKAILFVASPVNKRSIGIVSPLLFLSCQACTLPTFNSAPKVGAPSTSAMVPLEAWCWSNGHARSFLDSSSNVDRLYRGGGESNR